MNRHLRVALLPPVGAARYGCGGCAAPVTVVWLFGLASIVLGLFGGPTGVDGVSWTTVGVGFGMWSIAAAWALSTLRGALSGPGDGAAGTAARCRQTPGSS